METTHEHEDRHDLAEVVVVAVVMMVMVVMLMVLAWWRRVRVQLFGHMWV